MPMSDVIAEGIVTKNALQSLVDVQQTLVDEARLNLDDSGITMRAVDAANVGMNFTELSADAFESWDAPGSVRSIGVNLERLTDALDPAGTNDIVNIALDMESRKLVVDIDHIHQEIALIDPDAVRQEPDNPEIDLPNTAVIEGSDLTQALDVSETYGDRVDVVGDAEANALELLTEGDTDEASITFDGGRAVMMDVVEDTTSMYTNEYLVDMLGPLPSDSEVQLRFGDVFPIKLSWDAVDGHLDVEQMLAPRVAAD